MQEEVENKSVAISIKATKLTANVLKAALLKALAEMEKKQKNPKVYKGKQSVKHLVRQGVGVSNIEITDGNMSEELTFQERCFYIQEDFTVQCEIRDFIDTIQNERLAEGLRHLTDRQRQVIELYFWKGYQCKEIATMFGCSPAAVTDLMHRVYKRLRVYLMDR